MECQVEHLVVRLRVRHFAENLLGGAHLVIEVQRVRDQPLAMGADQHRAHTPEQPRACDCRDIGRCHDVPDQRKGFGPGRRARREVIGAVEIYVVDLAARHEGLNVERLVGLGHCLGDLLGLEGDVITGPGLVSLHLLFGFDALARFGVDELAMDAVARLAIEYMEGNPLGRRGRGIERDRAGHLAGF